MTSVDPITDTWRKSPSRARAWLLAITLATTSGCSLITSPYEPRAEMPGGVDAYRVTKVVSGDALALEIDGQEVVVRLIGIDSIAPVSRDRDLKRAGRDARRYVEKLLKGGKVFVELETDTPERDAHGRLLAYLYRYPDRLSVNAEIVKQGYATSVDSWSCRRHDELEAAEADARTARRGLWTDPSEANTRAKGARRPDLDPSLP